MKKIALLILCALFVLTTNTIHAQTILTAEGDGSNTPEDQQLNKGEGSEEITVQQDEQGDQNSNDNNNQDSGNNQSNNQSNTNQNTTTKLTPQKMGLSDRIRQQAKAVREKVMTQINRNAALSARRGVKLANPEEEARLQKEKEQQIIDQKVSQGAKVYKAIPGVIEPEIISTDGDNYADLGFYSVAYASDGTHSALSPETRFTAGPFDGMTVTYKKSIHEDPTKSIVGHEYFYYNYRTNTWYKNAGLKTSGNIDMRFDSTGDYIYGAFVRDSSGRALRDSRGDYIQSDFTETNEAPVYTDTSKVISETIGEKFRNVHTKMTDIQSKIEDAINTIPESDKINKDELRKTLQNSKQSLVSADTKIVRLEKIQLTKNIDDKTRELMSGAKKDFINSKQYLNTILVELKQATKAKAIIQTGGGTIGSGGTSGNNGGNGGQVDGNNAGGTGTGDQPRR